jgi:hypothetical protein
MPEYPQDDLDMLAELSLKISCLEVEIDGLKRRFENYMHSDQEMREAHGLY